MATGRISLELSYLILLFSNLILYSANQQSAIAPSRYFFERVQHEGDENEDNQEEAISLVEFHRCSLDEQCSFVVKKSKDDNLQRLNAKEINFQGYYAIWKKVEKTLEKAYLPLPVSSYKFIYLLNSYIGGTAGDALWKSQDRPFSTYDNDNDAATWNCAASWKGGWWHNDCFFANLNNDYYNASVPQSHTPSTMSWVSQWTDLKFGRIIYSEMKLRRL
eukprot:gene20452-22468_t